MAIQQPTSSDYLSSPDHSLSHRVFANDNAASVKAIQVSTTQSIISAPADGITAIQFNKADLTTNVMNIDTTNGRVGIGTTNPTNILSVNTPTLTLNAQNPLITGQSTSFANMGGAYLTADVAGGPFGYGLLFKTYKAGTGLIDSLKITHDGNVGIGTTSPGKKLHISGATNSTVRISSTDSGADSFLEFMEASDSAGVQLQYAGSQGSNGGALNINNYGGSAIATFDRGGNVGIGTTNPSYPLEVYRNGSNVELTVHEDAGTNTATLHTRRGSEDVYMGMVANSLFRIYGGTGDGVNLSLYASDVSEGQLYLSTNGNVGIGTTAPTAKTHIDQSSTTGAVPVLTVDQADVSEEFAKFIGTSSSSVVQSISSVIDFPNPGTLSGWLKIYIQDDAASGGIPDGAYYIPFYSIPLALGHSTSISVSPSASLSPSISPSISPSRSPSVSPSVSPSISPSI